MRYLDEIKNIILNTVNLTEPIESIQIESNLQNSGMNSITFVKVVVEIEKLFNIDFPNEKLAITQAGTIKDLCEIVMKVKGEIDEVNL